MRKKARTWTAVALLGLVVFTGSIFLGYRERASQLRALQALPRNLSWLGGGLYFYSKAHGGKLPDDLHELVALGLLDEVRWKQLHRTTTYLAAGRQLSELPQRQIIVVELAGFGDPELTCLLVDGSVTSTSREEATKLSSSEARGSDLAPSGH